MKYLPILHLSLLVLVLAIVIGTIVMVLIIRSITKPLKQLVTSSKQISEGDLTETIEIQSKDELGELGKSFNNMRFAQVSHPCHPGFRE